MTFSPATTETGGVLGGFFIFRKKERPSAAEMTDAELASACAGGHPDAFEMIYRKNIGIVFSAAYKITGSYHDAKDITQDVFIAAIEKIKTFKGSGSLSGWITRITVNRSISHLLRNKKRVDISSDNAPPEQEDSRSPEKNTAGRELASVIRQMTLSLPDDLREVFLMAAVNKTPYAETAAALDISTALVKVRVFRARAELKEKLDAYLKGEL
jgi:RNA polymerase sigma-70 factor (ECF subfamily)